MSGIDTIAAIVFGAYLVAVAIKGNAQKLLDTAIEDKAFLKWIIAIAVLFWMYSKPALRGPVSLLIAAAFIGFFMQAGPEFTAQVKELWQSLNSNDKIKSKVGGLPPLPAMYT